MQRDFESHCGWPHQSVNVSHSHCKLARLERNMLRFSVSTVPVDCLAPAGARPSAGAVLIKCMPCINEARTKRITWHGRGKRLRNDSMSQPTPTQFFFPSFRSHIRFVNTNFDNRISCNGLLIPKLINSCRNKLIFIVVSQHRNICYI